MTKVPCLWPLLCCLLLCGCGSKLASVEGTVTLDGKPLSTGTVVFQNEGLPMGVGGLSSNGSYTIYTGDQPGLPPGDYQVTVSAYQTRPGRDEMEEPIPVLLTPPRYNKPETSGLTAKVTPGSNRFDFKLEP